MQGFFLRITLFFVFTLCLSAKAAEPSRPIDRKDHLDILAGFKKEADNHVAQNLNKFALYRLQLYDVALDSLYKLELSDTVKSFKDNYDRAHVSRNTEMDTLNSEIDRSSLLE